MARLNSRQKIHAAALSVASNATLTAAKFAVALLTGSVGVLSEALHSLIDLVAAFVAFFAVRIAARPADKEHPYGHGKIENVSGTLEAILIFVAAGLIVHEAIHRVLQPSGIAMVGLGVAVMGVSAVVNTLVSIHLERVARRTDSAALAADAAHLRTDVYTSLAGMAGLAAVAFTGSHLYDPAVGLLISLVILWEAWMVLRRSSKDLLDVSLPESETAVIRSILEAHKGRFQDWHALRTRKAGSERKIDLHLTVCRDECVDESHALCDEIEREIQERLPGVDVMIHVEACERSETQCRKETCEAAAFDPEGLVQKVLEATREHPFKIKDLHVHRDKRGPQIDLSLLVPEGLPVGDAHRVCDEMEKEIERLLPGFRAMIHIEPG